VNVNIEGPRGGPLEAFAALGIGFQRDGGNVTADIANANDVGELGSAARWHDL